MRDPDVIIARGCEPFDDQFDQSECGETVRLKSAAKADEIEAQSFPIMR